MNGMKKRRREVVKITRRSTRRGLCSVRARIKTPRATIVMFSFYFSRVSLTSGEETQLSCSCETDGSIGDIKR